MEITPEHIRWAFRLFLDHEADETSLAVPYSDTWQLREHFLRSPNIGRTIMPVMRAAGRGSSMKRAISFVSLTLEDLAIARNIILGRYELSETEFVKAELQPGDVAVDIGANIGYYALLFATLVAPHGRVVAFEPVPFLYDALTRSVRENRRSTSRR